MAEPGNGRKRRVSRWIALAVLAGVAGGFYAMRRDAGFRERAFAAAPALRAVPGLGEARTEAPRAPPPPAAVPVSVAKAEVGDFPIVLTGLGTVQAANTVLVRSRVDGQITSLHFTEGQVVTKGDLLAEIDPRPYKAALEQAQAKKQQDDANLSNAQRDLGRFQSLAKNDYATKQQLDTQTSQVAQLTAQIAADQAAIDNTQTQLDYATIRSPLTGRAGFRLIDQGNIVNASSASGIVEIAQVQPIAVIYTEPENTLADLAAGQKDGKLAVKALASDGLTPLADGKLDTLNNEVDAGSGTIRIKALFDNHDNRLWPGLSVVTHTTVTTRRGVVIVPEGAVQRGRDGFFAYVVGADMKVQARPLKVTHIADGRALVDDGVRAGETVVTGGQYRLQPSTVVQVAADAEKTASKEP